MNDSVTNEYFSITKNYMNKYGEKTILLMQVGAFFEMYGIKDNEGNVLGSQIVDICSICHLSMPKKGVYGGKTIVMAGVRDYCLDKYLPKITDYGYTAIVYDQEKVNTKVTRKLSGIYSPGTSIENDNNTKITNNIMCIWLETIKNKKEEKIIYGISTINIFTGKSYIFEHQTQFLLDPTTFDELERAISVFSPSEVIFISPFEHNIIKTIQNYIGLNNINIHNININSEDSKIENCMKQTYINHMLSKQFGEEAINQCNEFNLHAFAIQSFCYLLDFIQEHNVNLLKNISIPLFNNTSTRTILANHTLKQLNIIDDNQYSGSLSSVLNFLNKCCYYGGKRLFKDQLTHPCFDETWLNNEYNIIEILKKENDVINKNRSSLSDLPDIEKILRLLVVRRISPYNLWQIYNSLNIIKLLYNNINNNEIMVNYFDEKNIVNNISEINKFIENNFIIDICKDINSLQNFETNFIKKGVSNELDEVIIKQQTNEDIFNGLHSFFNQIMRTTPKDENTEFIKKHVTATMQYSFQLTKKRASTLKSILQKKGSQLVKIFDEEFNLNEVKTVSSTSSNDEIVFPLLTKVLREKNKIQEKISEKVLEIFNLLLNSIEEDWLTTINKICNFASKLDVITNKAFIANKYNYCKPIINENSEQSFVKAGSLKHCLIEHLQTNETYVTNDIHLGCDYQDGILLYGTNAVGKTSLIRALGIAVILAQSGMYVPCSSFIYKPYTAIYSRILGNDNLFKGLSTFAVEISELRVIIRMANERSLILGDEVCSGTETESALSIFVTSLMKIYKQKSSFIFATHFHEIIEYDEIKNIETLALYHMHVIFDREQNLLIYDRKLKKGSGTRSYGLEVCKSLYLDNEFIDQAYTIRRKYFPEVRGELSNKVSRYNAKKICSKCEICENEISDEIHHLSPQKDADANGYIGSYHKNALGNLIGVCESCHNKLHKEDKVLKKKKTSNGIKLLE